MSNRGKVIIALIIAGATFILLATLSGCNKAQAQYPTLGQRDNWRPPMYHVHAETDITYGVTHFLFYDEDNKLVAVTTKVY